jgi:serine/threonine protein kinase
LLRLVLQNKSITLQQTVGSFQMLPYEALSSKIYSNTTDVFSLACVFFSWSTNGLPLCGYMTRLAKQKVTLEEERVLEFKRALDVFEKGRIEEIANQELRQWQYVLIKESGSYKRVELEKRIKEFGNGKNKRNLKLSQLILKMTERNATVRPTPSELKLSPEYINYLVELEEQARKKGTQQYYLNNMF